MFLTLQENGAPASDLESYDAHDIRVRRRQLRGAPVEVRDNQSINQSINHRCPFPGWMPEVFHYLMQKLNWTYEIVQVE